MVVATCNYKGLVNKLLPKAEIVADRFQVMNIVNQDLDAAQKTLRKANKKNPNQIDNSRIKAALKQSKYVLLKPEKLTEPQTW